MGNKVFFFLQIIVTNFLLFSCLINNRPQDTDCNEDCVYHYCFSYNDSIYKTAMTYKEFCWLFEIQRNKSNQVDVIREWSGRYSDTIFLTKDGYNIISKHIIPDSTFRYLGNDIESLLNRYFNHSENSESYCFVLDSIHENEPHNIQLAIMYIMTSNGLPMILDDETGFFYIDKIFLEK